MSQSFQDVGILLVRELPGPAGEQLAAGFHVYDAAAVASGDLIRFVEPIRDRIRGMVVSGRNAVPAALIDALPNLEIISCRSAGFDKIDLERARARRIVVTNASPACADDVADMAIALMLAAARGIVAGDRFVRSGAWGTQTEERLWTKLAGKTLGILGLGTIGGAIAQRAAGMRMGVVYHSRRRRDGVPYEYVSSVGELASRADVLALSCPGGAATRHLVDRDVLAALGPRGYLINVARGSVVDEDALLEALRAGTIAGAGIDVYEGEPKIRREFRELENVVLSPHAASATEETQNGMAQLALDNLIEHFSGRPALSPV